MTAYQQGLLTLRKLRLGGPQRISIQHIQVREGGQAIVGDVLRLNGTANDCHDA
jgi:hypothetical protein